MGDEANIAAATLLNLSRGTEVAAHAGSPRPAHLGISTRNNMDPAVGRQTRNTPREGDYAAFMNFMKMDDPEGDELRARKQRGKNAVQRERQEAYEKFKEEVIARRGGTD